MLRMEWMENKPGQQRRNCKKLNNKLVIILFNVLVPKNLEFYIINFGYILLLHPVNLHSKNYLQPFVSTSVPYFVLTVLKFVINFHTSTSYHILFKGGSVSDTFL